MSYKQERERLRELGRKVAEICSCPQIQTNKKLWTNMNDLVPTRPLIHTRDCPIYVLEYKNELTPVIEDEFLRSTEQTLLLQIYEWEHLKHDRVVEPYIECPVVFSDSGFGIESDKPDIAKAKKSQYLTSVRYEQQIFGIDDIEKIKTPVVEFDEDETKKRLFLLSEIFEGILPVKLFGRSQFNCTPLDDILTWTGIDNGMLFMATEPELIHSLISRYIEAQIVRIKQYERLGILSSNNSNKNVGNNCIGYTSQLKEPTESGIGAHISDIWGENSDQIMTCVSPEMSELYAFSHEQEWASMFPLYSYGCCEKLDNKIGSLLRYFPNIRKVSSSPYSNLESVVEQVGRECVISFKPNSNYLSQVGKPDMEHLRDEIITVCRLAQKYNSNIVINMKTIITLQSEPWRLWEWYDMAHEIIGAYFN